MSQENLEIVVRAINAAIARPQPDYSTMGQLIAPDHVFVPVGVASGIEQEAVGVEGFEAWQRELREFIPAELQLEGAVDVAPDKVLTVTTVRFEGKASGAGAGQRLWGLVTLRGGKLVRTEGFTTLAEALRALAESSE